MKKIMLSDLIDRMAEMPFLPVALTENSKHKSVRLFGIAIYVVWFLPALLVWITISGLLAIPALIQDA